MKAVKKATTKKTATSKTADQIAKLVKQSSTATVLIPPPATFGVRDLKSLQGALADLNKEAGATVYKTAADSLLSDVKFWFPTGCPTLDLACGGGFPAGRITEIFGKKESGKSTVVQQALVECQRLGGVAIYIDTEKAAHRERLRQLGLKEESLVHLEPLFVEDAFVQLFKLIKKVRDTEGLATRPILVVWDTIVFTPARIEVAQKGDSAKGYAEGDIKTEGMIKTQRAKLIRAYMSHLLDVIARQQVAFVFVNHITDKIGALFHGQYDKPGGTATEFAASLQILVKKDESVKMGEDWEQVGRGVKFKIEKTRLSIPKREVKARLNWFTGIDVPATVLDYLKERGLAKREGVRYHIPAPASLGELVITSGNAGEKTFEAAWKSSEELQGMLLGLMKADYEAVIPWKQPPVEVVNEAVAIVVDEAEQAIMREAVVVDNVPFVIFT